MIGLRPQSAQQGFTLVEVLVSMVILSIGILGLSVLQLAAVQNSSGGQLRSQATILAYDIIDSMRANSTAVSSGSYTISYDDDTPTNVNCYGSGASCSTAEMARSDVVRWRTVLANYLPSGNGQIARTVAGGVNEVTVSVSWFDPFSAEAGAEQITLVAELPL